jgi:hypothetical protein
VEKPKNVKVKLGTSVEEAAEKADSSIRQLQSLLMGQAVEEVPKRDTRPLPISPMEGIAPMLDGELVALERELQEAFARQEAKANSARALYGIRGKVVDSVAENILREWGVREGGLENDLVNRLVRRVLELLKLTSEVPQQPGRPFPHKHELSPPDPRLQPLIGKAFPCIQREVEVVGDILPHSPNTNINGLTAGVRESPESTP